MSAKNDDELPEIIDNGGERKRFDRNSCTAVGPIYAPVSNECQQSVDYTSTITCDHNTSEGTVFADQLSARVPADEMDINSFIMWTNQRAFDPEVANADFASKCNWVFGYVKGLTSDKSMILIIGQLYPDDTQPTLKIGYYIMTTPSNFFVPAGLNKDSAKFLLADFDAQNSIGTSTSSQANKRQRVQQPMTLRASITNQGESSIHLQDIDGNYHHTREKKEVSKREKELGPIWRLTKGREKHVMGKDCILQVSEYRQHIMDESIKQVKDSTSEYSDSSLIRQISTHPAVKEVKYLKMLLQANFGPDPTTSLLFSSFLPKQFCPGHLPTYTARCEYTQAAVSFEIAARVFYSKEFLKAMDPVMLILSGPLDTLSLVSDDLLLWTIERTFNKWGKTIRTDLFSSEFPDIALETPTGCALLLTSMLVADLTLLSGESLFLQERFYRTTIATQSAQAPTKIKDVNDNERDNLKTHSAFCRFHMAYLLQAKRVDGSAISPCKRGKDCRSIHSSLNTITKTTALSLASKFNPTLKESVIARIEEMTNKFKK
jgi:hypothetical protein